MTRREIVHGYEQVERAHDRPCRVVTDAGIVETRVVDDQGRLVDVRRHPVAGTWTQIRGEGYGARRVA